MSVSESLFLIKACNFIKKEGWAQVFSREFCKMFKNSIYTERFLLPLFLIYSKYINIFQGFKKLPYTICILNP